MSNSKALKNKRIVIKLGGTFVNNKKTFSIFLQQLSQLNKNNHCVLVHGGGKTLSHYCQLHNQSVRFDKTGKRITNKKQMLFADRILSGQINTALVRECSQYKISGVGLSGSDANLIVGTSIHAKTYTGVVTQCNIGIINTLCKHSFMPIICSVANDSHGQALNINADEVAQVIAKQWDAHYLLLLSDVRGVKIDKKIQPRLTVSQIQKHIKNKDISGGMVAKTENCLQALQSKIDTIVIGMFENRNLLRLLTGLEGSHIKK